MILASSVIFDMNKAETVEELDKLFDQICHDSNHACARIDETYSRQEVDLLKLALYAVNLKKNLLIERAKLDLLRDINEEEQKVKKSSNKSSSDDYELF